MFRTACSMSVSAAALMTLAGSALATGDAPRFPAEIDLTGAQPAGAAAMAGALVIVTDNEGQEIEIDIGPETGKVRVWGVDGIPSGAVFEGVTSLSLTTGAGTDAIFIRVFALEVMPISVNTNAGNSDVKIRYELAESSQTATTDVVVTGGTGEDKAAFEVESLAAGFVATWTVSGLSGNNEATAVINSPEDSDLMSVDFDFTASGGLDKYVFDVISFAQSAQFGLSADTGGADDLAVVTLDNFASGSDTDAAFALRLGTGGDTSEIVVNSPGGTADLTGSSLGGSGDDLLKLVQEANGRINLRLNGQGGHDYVDVFAKGSNVRGTPRLLGAGGNDFLKLFVDGPHVATPIIDGGAGYDIAYGFGTIINCEEVNN